MQTENSKHLLNRKELWISQLIGQEWTNKLIFDIVPLYDTDNYSIRE